MKIKYIYNFIFNFITIFLNIYIFIINNNSNYKKINNLKNIRNYNIRIF
jgi:hypothetical protein